MTNLLIIKQTQQKTYIDEIINNSADTNIFLLEKGNYYLLNPIRIKDKKNITIRGATGNPSDVSIIQEGTYTNTETGDVTYFDGIEITNSSHINLDSFTLSVDLNNGSPVCIVVSGSDFTNVTNCRFYGNPTNFVVYYSGPGNLPANQPTLDAYNNNQLSRCNIFEKNLVVSYFQHDSLVFALQMEGTVQNNIIYGCRMAVYMVKETVVVNNYLYNSKSNGITCSVPSHHLDVCNNVSNNHTTYRIIKR